MRGQSIKETVSTLMQLLAKQGNSSDVLTKSLVQNGRLKNARIDGHRIALSVELEIEVSYKKLFKLLIDKNMTPKQLSEKSGVNYAVLGKMRRGDGPINMDAWCKLCDTLGCEITDILEIIPLES